MNELSQMEKATLIMALQLSIKLIESGTRNFKDREMLPDMKKLETKLKSLL
jgi:hypothetical protein